MTSGILLQKDQRICKVNVILSIHITKSGRCHSAHFILDMRVHHVVGVSLLILIMGIWTWKVGLQRHVPVFFSSSVASSVLNIVNLSTLIPADVLCLKTKPLADLIRTTICVHSTTDYVSQNIIANKIWEEDRLKNQLRVLLREPTFSFIDAGANLGVYTMFAAALGRFVIAIECFRPNILRIVKAIQLENAQDRVVLIENAIFSSTGQYVKLESIPSNIGSQAVLGNLSIVPSSTDPFMARTIRFDDILPILKRHQVKGAMMKVDIEGSEHILCETGHQVFEQFNIPVVQMEWQYVRRFRVRGEIVLNFFEKQRYIPTVDMCQRLNTAEAFQTWPFDVYWMKQHALCVY